MISIAIIAKDNEKTLPALLQSLKGSVDEIILVDTGSTDSTKSIAQDFGCLVFDFVWCDDFSAARNFAYSKCSGDWIMWVDTDDVVRNADIIKTLVAQVDSDKTIDAIVLPYEYITDKNGNVINEQYRIRLTRKGFFEWKGAIHEDLIGKRKLNRLYNKEIVIKHTATEEDSEQKLLRNLHILEQQIDKENKEKNVDARTILYYGHTLFGLRRYNDARNAYITYTKISGWEEDLYLAYIRLSVCDRELKAYNNSVESIQMAWSVEPEAPEAYIQLGLTYFAMGLYKKAMHAAKAAQNAKIDFERLTVTFPKDYVWHPLLLLADSHLALNEYRDALKYYIKLKKANFPSETIDDLIAEIQGIVDEEDEVRSYADKFERCSTDEERKVLYDSIPLKLRSYPSIIHIRQSFDIKTTSSGKEVVFMCAHAYEEWTPDSIEKGIGGSEEAVINMAHQLKELGYDVSVYNTIQTAKEFDGVKYKPWWEFNPKDKTDFFIAWRHEFLFDKDVNATKKYLWLHDIVEPAEYTEERLARIDKILVLSQYHRENLPQLPDEKFFLTSNGVDVSLFDQVVERDPFKLIYTSSYDRGLEQLLEMWGEIKKRIPQATLDVYYGWSNFDERNKDNPERKLWKEKMVRLLGQEGVQELGRASHKGIAKAMLGANVWAYPTTWLETNCITGLKAQIAGAIPVVASHGALKETVFYGEKVDANMKVPEGQKEWLDALEKVVYSSDKYDRLGMMNDMRSRYSWQAIAQQWQQTIL